MECLHPKDACNNMYNNDYKHEKDNINHICKVVSCDDYAYNIYKN